MTHFYPDDLMAIAEGWRTEARALSAQIEAAETPFEIWTAQEGARIHRNLATQLETVLVGGGDNDCRGLGRVTVSRVLSGDGAFRDDVTTDDGTGDALDLATAVGMLAVAQHTLLCDGGVA